MRKAKRERIKKRLNECLTVGKLKSILAKFPDDMPIGRVGHFGEFWPMSEYDTNQRKSYMTECSWRDEDCLELEVLNMETPDIGPVPD